MVGPLVLLKLMHCKRLRHNKCRAKKAEDSIGAHKSTMKTEPNACEDYTCRVCLKEGNIPLYGDKDIVDDLNLFGGIEVQIDDNYPKYLCESCHSLLEGAILFRKTAQESEQTLKDANEHNLDFNNDNMSDNEFDYEEGKIKKKKDKKYYCRRCNVNFTLFSDYSEHKASLEHENMKVPCPVCNNLYNETYLKRHLLLHQSEVPFVCDICGKKFIMQGQFTKHRVTHFYDLPYKCSLCPYRGRFTESLKLHMRTHTGDKPYQCSECAKCFSSKSNLNKHSHVHKAERDFKCEFCNRGFNSKRNLELHFRVDHTGIKDHVCNICGKAFGYRKQMMKHQLKVHKREKRQSGRLPLYLQVESFQKNGDQVPISDNVSIATNKNESVNPY